MQISKICLSVSLFGLVWLNTLSAGANPVQAQRHYEIAASLLAQQEFPQAIQHYKKAIEYDPDSFDYHYELAYAYYISGAKAAALGEYQEARKRNDKHQALHYNLGITLFEAGQAEDAVQSFRTAIDLDPAFVGAYHNLGVVLSSLSRHEEALEYYRQAWKMAPQDQAIKDDMRKSVNYLRQHPTQVAHGKEEASHDEHHEPHWSYAGEGGPSHWGALKPEFAVCQQGTHQSPIDIAGVSDIHIDKLSFVYRPSALRIVNNGHTIQVNYDKGSQVKIGTQEYELLQFHFHTPSEHTLAGKPFDMELHLVHKNAQGQLAVVGVMLQQGEAHTALKPVWDHLPAEAGPEQQVEGATIDASQLLPAKHDYFHYTGSLTTPPCSEGVSWNVLKTPVTLSQEQLAAFRHLFPMNARPVQPLQGRKVTQL